MELLIKNAEIITMADDAPVISGGCIKIKDDKITYVGKECKADDADKVIDAQGGIVMPGLVNSHTHIPMTFLRGYADDMSLDSWLFDKIFPAEDKLDADTVYQASKIACAEMIKSGTTTFSDMYFFSDMVAKAAMISGLNANISRCVSGTDDSYKTRLEEAKSLFSEYDGENGGAIKIDFAVHAIYTSAKDTVRATAKAAKRYGANMHIHLSETMKENRDCYAKYGKSPTEVMCDWGVFENKTNAAHCVYLSEKDMDIIKENGVSISHNPTSNLKLASGVANLKEMMTKQICVGLGTDGASSNNSLNMFGELKLSALLHKGIRLDPTIVSAYEALKMATVGGASALGREDRGKICEGFRADIIILDSDAPSLIPMHNPISLAVYSASGAEVKTSIINGKIVMENREIKTIDVKDAKERLANAIKRIGI